MTTDTVKSMMTSQGGIRAAVAGLGMAGNGIVRSLAQVPGVQLVAAADMRENAAGAFTQQYQGRVYPTLEQLCEAPDVDAIWLATPTHLHCEHVLRAAEAGKHIVVEKPMAITMDECDRMIAAAEGNHVALIAGGTRSFDPAFMAMRDIITSGRLGSLAALATWSFTNWMLRPREPHEVDVSRGGGAVYNQAAHPLDVLRLLGGGMVRTVRAMTVNTGLRGRPCPGYFTAYLEFADGTPATLMYNGYGYMAGWELLPWGETEARLEASERTNAYRQALRAGTADEREARETFRFGGIPAGTAGPFGPAERGWVPQDAGLVIATCERGEIRQSQQGLYVYDDLGRHDEALLALPSFRESEVAELRAAMTGERRPLHDGRWGKATIEVLLALMQSAEERREIELRHQVPVTG